jgi:hypothetical protein
VRVHCRGGDLGGGGELPAVGEVLKGRRVALEPLLLLIDLLCDRWLYVDHLGVPSSLVLPSRQ